MYISGYKSVLLAIFTLSFAWTGTSYAQGTSGFQHSIGGFVGATDRFDTDFTVGGEYEYQLSAPWSVGAIVEYTPNVILGDDYTLLLGTVNYRLPSVPRLKLTGGAGAEFKDLGGDDLRLRLGAGYDVFQGPFTLTPRVAVDFGDGDENIVLGLSVLRRF